MQPLSYRVCLKRIDRLLEHLRRLDQKVDGIETHIKAWHRSNELSRRLEQIPGIGPITATAMVASVGDARSFKSGRELAAWLGLVPRQHSSGGKPTLLGMSKRGDVYLRTLLIHGTRSLAYSVGRKANPANWLYRLMTRRNWNVAVVAQANKPARLVWAVLFQHRAFRPETGRAHVWPPVSNTH